MSDEGVAMALAPCWSCGVLMSFHPHRVPSILVDGVRQPVCRECVETANVRRVANGLDPIPILPGAYEPIPIGEL